MAKLSVEVKDTTGRHLEPVVTIDGKGEELLRCYAYLSWGLAHTIGLGVDDLTGYLSLIMPVIEDHLVEARQVDLETMREIRRVLDKRRGEG